MMRKRKRHSKATGNGQQPQLRERVYGRIGGGNNPKSKLWAAGAQSTGAFVDLDMNTYLPKRHNEVQT